MFLSDHRAQNGAHQPGGVAFLPASSLTMEVPADPGRTEETRPRRKRSLLWKKREASLENQSPQDTTLVPRRQRMSMWKMREETIRHLLLGRHRQRNAEEDTSSISSLSPCTEGSRGPMSAASSRCKVSPFSPLATTQSPPLTTSPASSTTTSVSLPGIAEFLPTPASHYGPSPNEPSSSSSLASMSTFASPQAVANFFISPMPDAVQARASEGGEAIVDATPPPPSQVEHSVATVLTPETPSGLLPFAAFDGAGCVVVQRTSIHSPDPATPSSPPLIATSWAEADLSFQRSARTPVRAVGSVRRGRDGSSPSLAGFFFAVCVLLIVMTGEGLAHSRRRPMVALEDHATDAIVSGRSAASGTRLARLQGHLRRVAFSGGLSAGISNIQLLGRYAGRGSAA